MNNEQIKKNKNIYTIYILIGVLYVLIKIVFVMAGYLHLGAILHGLIPSVIAIAVGFMALREFTNMKAVIWHKVMVTVPVLIFAITPVYMFIKEGESWLINGRLEVLIIYEILSLIQFLIALKQLKNMR